MKQAVRTIVYDQASGVEAYRFEGMAQPFPNHFHAHYVIGLVENGRRALSCKNKEYQIEKGSVVLFHPGDNHACAQSDGGTFDYRGLNLPLCIMFDLAEEVTGKRELPGFSENVLHDDEITRYLRTLHDVLVTGASGSGKKAALLRLISALMRKYGQPFERCAPDCPREIEQACAFIRQHFRERIDLERICRCVGLSKSTLLRAFTKTKGITPYRYLEAIRINEARALLKQGVPPVEAAMRTGFSDQSHFTNYFTGFIGLAPGVYRGIFCDRDGE